MLTWWPIYPRFFRELFEQAFTVGLANPVTGRVPEGIWRRALNRLGDCVSRCRCTASVFYDPDDPGVRCWNCGQVPIRPPLLQRNVGPDDWVMTPAGESAVTVPSRRRLGVRTMVIDFGSVKGQISVD